MTPSQSSIERMKKILHTSRYQGLPLQILQSSVPDGFCVETRKEATREALLEQARSADYFLVSGRLRIDTEILDAAPNLKMIQRTGVGTEMLDLEAIRQRGIPVYVNAGVNAQSVAEHTLLLMLACLKRLPQVNAAVHRGIWKKQETGVQCHELSGKVVGLVGMGHIGRIVASLLQAFGAHVSYTDVVRQSPTGEGQLQLTYYPRLEDMLPEVDILSFHCPLTPENTRILHAGTLSMMHPGSIVVNTARGKLIDPDALYDALLGGRIAAAGLDTHFEEPLPKDYKLALLDNVILTPHIGGLSQEAFRAMMFGAMDNISAFEAGDLQRIADRKLTY